MTTARKVKDEPRRQKNRFNKTGIATKFLDALRIGGAGDSRTQQRRLGGSRKRRHHDTPCSCLRRTPAFVQRKNALIPSLLEKTDGTDRLKVVWPPRRLVPPYCGSTKVLPFFCEPFARKELAGLAEVLLTGERTLLQTAGSQFTNLDDAFDERSRNIGALQA